MDERNFKLLAIGFIGVFLLLTIILSIFLTERTVMVSALPNDAYMIFQGETYQGSFKVKLRPGEYTVTEYATDYKREEKKFKVRLFGKNSVEMKLKNKMRSLLEDGNYPFEGLTFVQTKGSYNDFGEPTYIINSFGVSKEKIYEWLRGKGVDPDLTEITITEDGD